MGNLASDGMRDFMQMTGSTNIGDTISNLSNSLSGMMDNDVVKGIFNGIGGVATGMNDFLEKMSNKDGLIGS
jgi:hypothetical protein